MSIQPLCFKNLPGLLLILTGGLFLTHCDSATNHDKDMVAKERWDSLAIQHQAVNRALKHLSDKRTTIYMLEALPLAEGTGARVYYNPKSKAVYLVADSLPKPDPDEAYFLWSFNTDDVPTQLGGINMDRSNAIQPLGTVEDPAIFVISREKLPPPRSPSPERIQCAARIKELATDG